MEGSLAANSTVGARVHPPPVFGRLRLTAGKAAELCGVTRRQLCYWTDKGIIPCCNGGAERGSSRRIYDFAGISKALMLKRLMDEGRGLRRAVRELKLRFHQAAPTAPDTPAATDEHAMLAQAERLTRLSDQARQVSVQTQRREALERLALALQPLVELSQAACDGRTSVARGDRAGELTSLVSEAERAMTQAS